VTAGLARALALAGLLCCLAVTWWPPPAPAALVGGLPLALLVLLGLRPTRRWGGWVAVVAIPYLAIGVMNLLAGPAAPAAGFALSGGAVVMFFAGLDWTRRTGGSLR